MVFVDAYKCLSFQSIFNFPICLVPFGRNTDIRNEMVTTNKKLEKRIITNVNFPFIFVLSNIRTFQCINLKIMCINTSGMQRINNAIFSKTSMKSLFIYRILNYVTILLLVYKQYANI